MSGALVYFSISVFVYKYKCVSIYVVYSVFFIKRSASTSESSEKFDKMKKN